MIVDFQHHFTPHELMPKDLGRRKIVTYDEHGAPSFILHWMLFDLDEHIRMMDESGIDVAFLTSAAGMCADLDKSRLCNASAKKAERDYPGRFIGAAHANPLGGAEAFDPERRDKRADFAQLALVMGRDDQLRPDRVHRPHAFNWAAKMSAQPIRARRSRRSRPSSSKVAPSAVN